VTPDRSKQQYIKVHTIDEIDPNKLSISQITSRYIDKDNNRYALRFNKETRRIEIIKLGTNQGFEVVKQEPRPSPEEKPLVEEPGGQTPIAAPQSTVPISETPIEKQVTNPSPIIIKKNPTPESKPVLSEKLAKVLEMQKEKAQAQTEEGLLGADIELDIFQPGEMPPSPLSSSEEPKLEEIAEGHREDEEQGPSLNPNERTHFLTPNQRIEEFIKQLGIYRERANAIIKNLQSSRIFEITGDPSENKNIVGNFAREMEARVFEAMDKMVDLHKEMTSYPRPITYYISKAPLDKREEMKLIDSDKEKLDKLHLFEMQKHTENIVRAMKDLSLQLMNILTIKTETQVKQLQYPNQLMYVDAKNASLYFAQDLDKSILDVEHWKNSK